MQQSGLSSFGRMLSRLLMLSAILTLAGCISSSNPSPPERNTTVVVPQGSTAVCADGTTPPCRY